MVGVQGSSQAEATGLERLLLVDEVSFVDVPDLSASAVTLLAQTAYPRVQGPWRLPRADLTIDAGRSDRPHVAVEE